MRYTTSLVLLLSTSTILLFHQCSAAPVSSNSRELLADVSRSFSFRNTGDSLIDFSFAGYRAGAEAVPSDTGGIQYDIWPTLDERDRTTDIQNALDAVGNLGGGIVRLAAGNYTLSTDDPLVISHSNVALRGDDSKFPSETVLVVTGGAKRNIIQLGSVQERNLAVPDAGQSVIAQEYVPLGATSVRVESAADFSEGQSVVLRRQVTEEWIAAMQMDDLTWLGVNRNIDQERDIVSIANNTIFFSVPLTDPINQTLSAFSASVIAVKPASRIYESGVESITFLQPDSAAGDELERNVMMPLNFAAAEDCWARKLHSTGFIQFAYLMPTSRRITLSDFTVVRDLPTFDGGHGALPLDVTLAGTQALVLRGTTIGDQDTASFVVATVTLAAGPNVVSGYKALNSSRHVIQPHERWATGFLVEKSHVGQILMTNRNILGSGQGWSVGTGVVYSSTATKISVEDPPTSRNFAISSNAANYLSNGKPAPPPGNGDARSDDPRTTSLYELQLAARIGDKKARAVIGPP